ncbi:MAG: DUF1622 domain-containing protein [Bryobacteraceae bacterium]
MAWFFDQAKNIIDYVSRGVEFAAALIIGLAAIEATIKAVILFLHRGAPPEAKSEVRLTLGRWLAVGLEFELAADILRTITPSWHDIEQLAAIAALRTALNYFLERAIRQESEPKQRRAEAITLGPRNG